MKEITVLSGKGGTGKTTITAALASVAQNAVFCDNDVDAADLHLIFQPEILETHSFNSGNKAIINSEKCTDCGICVNMCRFDAIHLNKENHHEINTFECEGCRLCERTCPERAISLIENNNNFWYVSETRFGTLVHARMGPGEENSGRLVTKIRQRAKKIADQSNIPFILNDGPPGIGCAAISSITGTNMVLLVTEPTLSGLHDAKRLVSLVESFNIPIVAVINKFDLSFDISEKIENFFKEKNIQLIDKIKFSPEEMITSVIEGKTVVEFAPESNISKQIRHIWKEIENNPGI